MEGKMAVVSMPSMYLDPACVGTCMHALASSSVPRVQREGTRACVRTCMHACVRAMRREI